MQRLVHYKRATQGVIELAAHDALVALYTSHQDV